MIIARTIVLFALLLALPRSIGSAEHWSLQPLVTPPLPTVRSDWPRTPIDQFILSKLDQAGMHPSPQAEKPLLLRRVYFDLIGLPPTPEELDRFVADESPTAFVRVVDQLLERPEYGERWARHWLDIAHYAESHGHDQDRIRTNGWPYRDYVIASFNSDKPYARFVQEQVAGDILFPDDPFATVAMGFLATGPWDESSLRDIREDTLDRQIARYVDRDDIVSTVMNTFVSTTVQCARCHDHKFDPVSQKEYYSLQAVFAGTEKGERYFDVAPKIHRERQRLLAEMETLEGEALTNARARFERLPKPSIVFAGARNFIPDGAHKPSRKAREVHLLRRGEITRSGELAIPGALNCLPDLPGELGLTAECDEGERRAAFSRWLTDPRNALTWRSIVNRVWHYHFGRGLVSTPNDFGRMGSSPTHPELLDWLATWFRDGGGSFKALHRLILNSSVYQQSSRDHAPFAAHDAENTLLWRMNRSRLDAESSRDAILAISGKLLTRMGGPSDQQFTLYPGIHVTPNVDYASFDIDSAAARRRSIYRFIFRTLPDPLMDALDCPDSSQLTPVRNSSITVAQALALWNDRFTLRYSEHFAARLEQTAPTIREQVRLACKLVWCREPRITELDRFAAFVRDHGLPSFCRVLFNSNEFIFVH